MFCFFFLVFPGVFGIPFETPASQSDHNSSQSPLGELAPSSALFELEGNAMTEDSIIDDTVEKDTATTALETPQASILKKIVSKPRGAATKQPSKRTTRNKTKKAPLKPNFTIYDENLPVSEGHDVFDFLDSSPEVSFSVKKKTNARTKHKTCGTKSGIKKTDNLTTLKKRQNKKGKTHQQQSSEVEVYCDLDANFSDLSIKEIDKSKEVTEPVDGQTKENKKKASGRPKRNTKKTDIDTGNIYPENMADSVNKSERKVRSRVTRSKTMIEGQRYDSECESDELAQEIDVSDLVELVVSGEAEPHLGRRTVHSQLNDQSHTPTNESTLLNGLSPLIERRGMDDDSPVRMISDSSMTWVSPDIQFSPVECARMEHTLRNTTGLNTGDVDIVAIVANSPYSSPGKSQLFHVIVLKAFV